MLINPNANRQVCEILCRLSELVIADWTRDFHNDYWPPRCGGVLTEDRKGREGEERGRATYAYGLHAHLGVARGFCFVAALRRSVRSRLMAVGFLGFLG